MPRWIMQVQVLIVDDASTEVNCISWKGWRQVFQWHLVRRVINLIQQLMRQCKNTKHLPAIQKDSFKAYYKVVWLKLLSKRGSNLAEIRASRHHNMSIRNCLQPLYSKTWVQMSNESFNKFYLHWSILPLSRTFLIEKLQTLGFKSVSVTSASRLKPRTQVL